MVSILPMTEKERLFLVAKDFNTNLVHFLPPYHVIVSNVDACSFKGMISHVHGHAPKMVLHARNLVYENLSFMKA